MGVKLGIRNIHTALLAREQSALEATIIIGIVSEVGSEIKVCDVLKGQ